MIEIFIVCVWALAVILVGAVLEWLDII